MNRQITLAARPVGFPQESDFALVESPVPEPGPGEVLVRSHWLSLDPYMRGRMSEARSYAKPTQVGEVMTGQVVGEVVASEDGRFGAGGPRRGSARLAGLRARARRSAEEDRPRARTGSRRTCTCSGSPGLTAYFGLFDVGRPKPGDTVVVSGAAGAVGQVVGQLARIAGCRTIAASPVAPRRWPT